MKKKKLLLSELRIQSFITSFDAETIKGGAPTDIIRSNGDFCAPDTIICPEVVRTSDSHLTHCDICPDSGPGKCPTMICL